MKKSAKNRIFLAWLLMAVFLSPFAVKGVHACHPAGVTAGNGHATHDCTSCAICHFAYFCFVDADEAEIPAAPFAGRVMRVERRVDVLVHRVFSLPSRAPPVA
ncbi:MAG: hypothetical protein LBI96_06060 [Odoribacteraceae bacterium]|nr:hypothetical protein [Odoribacteraceae bacterium]